MALGSSSSQWWRRPSSTRRSDPRVQQITQGGRTHAQNVEYYRPGSTATSDREWWLANVPQGMRAGGGYQAYMQGGGLAGLSNAGLPALTGSSGGGGRGYGGGGGGGGGGSAMTQAMFDAMMQAIGTAGKPLALQQVDLPDFRGQNLPAFNAAPYDLMVRQLAQAVAADQAAIGQAGKQATTALGAYSANPYAMAAAAPPPQAQAQGAALQATAGGVPGGATDANAQAAAAVNAGAGAETAAFNDLLKVLGANYAQAQNSRMGEVAMNTQSARNMLGVQNRAMGGQIGMARTQAMEAWRQADAERRYQNSLMSQQWQREEMMRNQEIANQQAQGNWQQRNELISNRLTPLLQLLQGTAGTNINTSALQQMLQGWAA